MFRSAQHDKRCHPEANRGPHGLVFVRGAEKPKDLRFSRVSVTFGIRTLLEFSLTLGFMRERCYYTYIVASRTHVLYIGVTGNIESRIAQHKARATEGFTAKYNCNRLVWFERYTTPSAAIAREKELKGWLRARKLALIERDNPTWIDLSENWGKPIPRLALS